MAEIILTEKFSVASDFAKALGIAKRGEGCFRNEHTIITWAVGHLVELWEPQDYDPNLKKWRVDTLPIMPERFKYKPIGKTSQQFKIIKSLLKEKNIERIIIATDAGREGEVIARTILLESGFTDKQKIFRFWTSQALVPDVVRVNMNQLKPIYNYDRLWRAGYYRQVADWLVGMNFTRMVTLMLGIRGELFSVGRVQTAVLALIVNRGEERERFVPEIYWIIKVLFSNEKGRWTGYWFKDRQTDKNSESDDNNPKSIHTLKNRDDVNRILQLLNNSKSAVVQSVKKENKKEPSPFLFSLTDLQQEANRRFGFSAQKTLNIAQTLYQDKKCLSYPRTDSRVLGSQNLDMVQNIIIRLKDSYGQLFQGVEPLKISLSNKRVFNDAKLTDHHALIPFKPVPADADRDEQSIFNMVMTRFAAAFYPDCEFENTQVITLIAGETFQTNGRVILAKGWRELYQDQQMQDREQEIVEHIPPLAKGDSAVADKITSDEKKTTPPPEYTDSLLLKDMTNPGRYVEEEEIKKLYRGEVGIGTQATRAQIIETLINRKYIERSGKRLVATPKGVFLVQMLRKCKVTSVLISPEETARWEMSLNKIALGEEVSAKECLGEKSDASFLTHIKNFILTAINELKTSKFDSAKFQITTIPPHKAKNTNISDVKKTDSLPSKSDDSGEINALCPMCGGNIIEGKKGYGCSNWRPENGNCYFVIWKEIMGKKLSQKNIKTLAAGKTTPVYVLKDSNGDKFKAKLKMIKHSDRGYSIEITPQDGYQLTADQRYIICSRA
ncbi:MAG: DNA topoisomerase III [Desulfamplus sp.]